MSRSRKERSLFDARDYNYHGVPVYHNDLQSQIFFDEYGQPVYPVDQFMYSPEFYPNPMMGQMSYDQYPPAVYYPPPPPSPPVQVSQTPFNKYPNNLPRVPKGNVFPEQTLLSSTPAVVMPAPAQPFVVPYMAPVYDQPGPYYHPHLPPAPQYYHERVPLPHIPQGRRRSRSEHDYHSRSHREHPLIMSYFGRRHNVDRSHHKTHWYD